MDKKIFIKNRPFDVNDANDMQNWTENALKKTMASIYSSGIVNGLAVSVNSNLKLNIGLGTAFDSNYDFINVLTTQTITLDAANTSPRIDKIAIKYVSATTNNVDTTNIYGLGTTLVYSQNKKDGYLISFVKGTPAASPVAPATPAGSLLLAEVTVPANATALIAGNIVDRRAYININNNIITPEVVFSGTAPTDTNTLWIDTTNLLPKIYKNSVWTVLKVTDADTLDGNHASAFALSGHNHDTVYYTKIQSDANYAPKIHNHDGTYYTETELNTSGAGGAVHWNNLTNKPLTFAPATHNHDGTYYTETESDAKYLQKSDNLSALVDKAAARTNLGLGSAATANTSTFAPAIHNHDGVYTKGDYILVINAVAPTASTKTIWWDTTNNLIKRYTTTWVTLDASDAASVGGLIPGTGANNLLKLDSSGKVPNANINVGSTSQAGIIQLNNTVTSTLTTQAATANAVKIAYDKANAALPATSYTAADVLAKIKTLDGSGSTIDSDTVDGKHFSDIQNEINTYKRNQGELWYDQKGFYMNGTQTVTPSKPLNQCRNGWILVWSDFDVDTNTGNDYDINYSYVPKALLAHWADNQHSFPIANYSNSTSTSVTVKKLTINNTTISGSSDNYSLNTQTSDVVLRGVYEW